MCDYKKFTECQVCGHEGVERFETYSHCVNCQGLQDHSISIDPIIPDWAQNEYQQISKYFDFLFARLNRRATS